MSWKLKSLDELGFVSRGRSRHRPRDAAHLYGGPHPFVQTGDVKHAGLYLTNYTQTYSEDGLVQSRMWPAGTLCITIAANIADTAILGFDACFPDSVIGFIPDKQKADARFIKYLFDTLLQRKYKQFTQGAAQDNLSQAKLLSLRFPIPGITEQKLIADKISAYDDLIENNRRRIQLLEQAARLLYKEWFVHLRFPGHEHSKIVDGVPEGWEQRNLQEIATIQKGKNITKDMTEDGVVPVVAGGLKPAYYHNVANTTGSVITVSASGANAGHVALYHQDIWASDCSYLSSSDNPEIWFFYLAMVYRQPEITRMQQGAAQPHVYPKHLMRLSILYPPQILRNLFHGTVEPIFLQIANHEKQIDNLAKARDLLLPKLMNGEVEV
ncbi:MAG: restriction endonuclease subunit S [Deltaproteobacteria bacterium]|jgi:type I restriction enzyme S subunit|nr:restriction endonuclease subunit S [Deltaproteobacteria bacterium]